MKIIEGLKKIKDLKRKADDLKGKVETYCVDLDCDTPTYPDQKRQISEWLQAHSDVIKEILHIRLAIQRTNLETEVSIELGGKFVTKTIAEWVHRRRDLAKEEENIWQRLTEKNYQEQYKQKLTDKAPEMLIKRRLYFDPKERDTKRELYRSEPGIIDGTLEVVNATTELIMK